MSANLRPARIVPPGRIIERELEARAWTQKDLAEIMGRPPQAINEIVRGRKAITPETAYQLAEAFGTSPDLWLGLEAQYRLHLAGKERDGAQIAQKSQIYSRVPVSELQKRSWIRETESVYDLENEVCAFLGIDSIGQQPQVATRFRDTPAREPEHNAQIAWVQRVKHLAQAQKVETYELSRVKAALPELFSHTIKAGDVAQVPALLQNLGIHFLIVPHLPHTYLDGATFTIEGHPVIALTLRYNRIDSFWFTLLHELAHVVAGHEGVILDNLDEQNGSDVEQEANRKGLTYDLMMENAGRGLAEVVHARYENFCQTDILGLVGSGNNGGDTLVALAYLAEWGWACS